MHKFHPPLQPNSKHPEYLMPDDVKLSIELKIIFITSGILLLLMWAGCSEVQRDYTKAPPAQPSTWQTVTGKWIDVDETLKETVASKDVLMSVVGSDRWESMIIYQLRTNQDHPATLVVIKHPDCVSDTDICNIVVETRVGRFRNVNAEKRLLSALKQQFDSMY